MIRFFVLGFAVLSMTVPALAQTKKRAASKTTAPVAEAPRMQEISQDSEIRRGLKFEAFLDPKFVLTNKDENTERGFTLNDAALYISKDFGQGLSALIDLPFGQPQGNAVAFGTGRSQAYFLINRNNFIFHFGEFDTFFGIELNDSRDRFFAASGGVKQFLINTRHQGLAFGYGIEKVLLRVILSNPQNSTNMANQNPEFGLQARFETDNSIYGSLGLLINDSKTAPNSKNGMLLDIMGGVKLDKIKIDGEIAHKKTPGEDKAALGFAVIGVYNAMDELDLGGRFEYIKDPIVPVNDPAIPAGVVLGESAFQFSFGPSYKVMTDVSLRGDISLGSIKIPNASDTSIFGLTLSLVASL